MKKFESAATLKLRRAHDWRILGLRSYRALPSPACGGGRVRAREERIFFNRVGRFCKRVRNMRIMPHNKISSPMIVDTIEAIANGTSESESGGESMKTQKSLYLGVAAVAIALAFGVAPTTVVAQQPATVSVGATDIGGVVRGPNGPEAGVWGIAGTTGLPAKMSTTVVADDHGPHPVPDLPQAH